MVKNVDIIHVQAKAIWLLCSGGKAGLYQGTKLQVVLDWEQEVNGRWKDVHPENVPFTASQAGLQMLHDRIQAFRQGRLFSKVLQSKEDLI